MTSATAEPPQVETHGDEHHAPQKPRYDDVNVPVIILVGFISAIVTFLTIAFVQGMCYHWQNSKIKARSTETVNVPAREEIASQKAILDGGDGTISIEDAMKQVIDEYGKK